MEHINHDRQNPGQTGRPAVQPASLMPDRKERPAEPAPWQRRPQEDRGPARPEVDTPDHKDLLKKMRRVDPNQARRYRQRTGE